MKKIIRNIGVVTICLIPITYWIINNYNNSGKKNDEEIMPENGTDPNSLKSEKKQDTPPIDSLLTDTTRIDTLQNILVDSLLKDTTITDSLTKEEEIGEITYTLVDGETFREATVKLKAELEKGGYDYNKVKQEHVFFIIDSGKTKLNWNTAVKRYLDKKQPTSGDYFFMKKFFY